MEVSRLPKAVDFSLFSVTDIESMRRINEEEKVEHNVSMPMRVLPTNKRTEHKKLGSSINPKSEAMVSDNQA